MKVSSRGRQGTHVKQGEKWTMGDTGLTVITVLRHDLTEIKPKMGEISNS